MRRWLEPLAQDLGYAVRSSRRSPAFLLVALLSLTLGIGATSAIFRSISKLRSRWSNPFPKTASPSASQVCARTKISCGFAALGSMRS